MRKFLRNLFSGYFLILLLLLVELGVIIALQFFSDDILNAFGLEDGETLTKAVVVLGYLFFRLAVFIIAVIIFFKIIGKIEDPEFKIPWIVAMIIMPLLASVLFLIFGNHGLRRKDKRVIDASVKANEEVFTLSKREIKEYSEDMGTAWGAFNYINNVTKLGAHKGNRVTYYKSGEEFFPAMTEALRQAEEFIFIEFFIIADGELWSEVTDILKERAKAGVDVRIVYDDMGSGGTISSFTPRILRKYGIRAYKFHPFRPILSGVYNNRDHRKIVIVDHKCAFTGGMNLADEYANKIDRFGYWKDSMIKIEGSAIGNLIVTFLQNYDLCCSVVSRFKKYLDYDYPVYEDKGYVMPFGDGPGGIDDALIGEQTYINMINFAQKELYRYKV